MPSDPTIGIAMGSDSDLPVMDEAAEVLDAFDVSYEMRVLSAHRTPTVMHDYAEEAQARGLDVIIAGAGGAAHLPGMIAASTPLPVIGVPVKTSTLNGVDSLLSIVQMPGGVPVASVAINAADNAALLAVQILGVDRPELREQMVTYKADLKETVGEMDRRVQSHASSS
ncbi:MAG: 5-(carboxyamino)imidazole ribonucleotide mutase [Salinibacter sp.]